MRRFSCWLATHAAGSAPRTPYEVVLQAVEHDGRGLLAAAEVFRQFQRFYQAYQSSAATAAAASSTSRGSAVSCVDVAAGGGAGLMAGKPLTQFCGRPEDVEPMTVLLLKVLCDLQKLEEMRFLFTQCLLELDDRTPSVELFNVFLLAISMTDTFNQYEVENLVELQRAKGIVPDVVTKLSMFLLYLRLGHHSCVDWWPGIRDDVEVVLDAGAVARYPILPLRLQHCFQTLLRVHHDSAVLQECFELLYRVAPERVTATTVLPYVLLCAMNMSAPPSAVVGALRAVEARQRPPAEPSAASPTSTPASAEPVLTSETTMFRLLAKCAKYGDAEAAAYLRAYIDKYRRCSLVAPENEPVAALLYVEALTKAGRVRAALRVLETAVPAPHHRPGERPKLFLNARRLSLLSTDPVRNVVAALTPLVAATEVEDPALSLVAEKLTAEEADEREPVPVSAITLDLLLAACELVGGGARAEQVLRLYPRYDATPTCHTYATLLEVYAATAPEDGALRLPSLQREMAGAGVQVDAMWLRAAMSVALNAHDVSAALRIAELNVSHRVAVDVKHGVRLLREAALSSDEACMRRALHLLRSSNSHVDSRSVALCTAVLRNMGLTASALRDDTPSSPAQST